MARDHLSFGRSSRNELILRRPAILWLMNPLREESFTFRAQKQSAKMAGVDNWNERDRYVFNESFSFLLLFFCFVFLPKGLNKFGGIGLGWLGPTSFPDEEKCVYIHYFMCKGFIWYALTNHPVVRIVFLFSFSFNSSDTSQQGEKPSWFA